MKLSRMQMPDVVQVKAGELTLDQLIVQLEAGGRTAGGEIVTPESALKSPTVYAIVNRLSSMFAQLPFSIVKDKSTADRVDIEELRDHPASKLIDRRPNRWQTPFQFKAQLMTNVLLRGRYAAEIGRARGEPRFIAPLDQSSLEVDLTSRNRARIRWTEKDGTKGVGIVPSVLLVNSSVSLDGLTGLSPVERCKESIALEIAAEKFGASTFGNGAIPNVILMRTGKFKTDEGRNRFREAWNNMFGNKKRGTAILEGDEWKAEKIQMSNDEAQFLETRKLQRSIIAGMFNIPPHMAGDLERATFSNISSQSLEVLMYTLAPLVECIESAINQSLLTEDERERERLFARFDTKRLLRGDIKSTADFIGKMRQWGIINANEGRAMVDMNARSDDAGDDYITPNNFEDQDAEDQPPPDMTGDDEDGDEDSPRIAAVP